MLGPGQRMFQVLSRIYYANISAGRFIDEAIKKEEILHPDDEMTLIPRRSHHPALAPVTNMPMPSQASIPGFGFNSQDYSRRSIPGMHATLFG